ncbi:hypothetical protein ACB092_02G148100 [Castanea dentata]
MANKQQISHHTHHTQRTSSSSELISFLRPPTSDIQPTNSPKAKQRLGDTVRERIRSTEITHKASISKKVADMRRWRSPYPNAPPFPPATTRSWLTCRLFLNPHAKTHLRIWKPIMKNASTLAEKISMEVTQDLSLSVLPQIAA